MCKVKHGVFTVHELYCSIVKNNNNVSPCAVVWSSITYSLRWRAGGRTTDPASDPKTRSSGSFPFETSFLDE